MPPATDKATWQSIRDKWRSVFTPPPQHTVSQWSEKHVELTIKTSARAGPLRLKHSPYCRQPIDDFGDPNVEEITLCFGSQVGKTIILFCQMGFAIDHDPGPGLIVFGNADQAKDFSRDKLQPFIVNCPSLARHMTGKKEDFNNLDLRLDRMDLALEGSNSPTNLASRAIRYLWLDEIDKYPGASAKEAASADLCEKRTRTYSGRQKIVRASTPSLKTGEIWQSFQRGDQRRYWVPCPHCGEFQILKWSQVIYPDARLEGGGWDEERIRRETFYKCEHCEDSIGERHKFAMINAGHWRPKDPNLFSRHRSYQLSALYSTFETWGKLAVKWVNAQGNPEKLKAFIQNELGEPWEERGEVASEAEILKRREPYKPGTYPAEDPPLRVIMTADVQKHVIWWVVRAWGRYETSWLLDYGIVSGFEGLEDLRSSMEFDGLAGEKYRVTNAFIDSGAFTDDVYAFCKRCRWMPTKGFDGSQQTQPLAITKLAQFSLLLLRINVDHYKEALQARIEIPNGNPGAWHLHCETDSTYAKHLTAEELVREIKPNKKGRVDTYWKKIREENHLLDNEVMQLACAQHLGVRHRTHAPAPATPPPRESTPFVRKPNRPPGGNFIRRHRR